MADNKILRCAIYTRKSHEEGLEQEFNSLDAQRESAEAYIASQKHQGWQALPTHYDDGGFSGGTMERPAIKQLMADIEDDLVDVIVVYKLDRLSRSLLDFMNLIEHLNAKGVSFVSVTQDFSTTTPTGRMFLGILITFAQYERETIAERIRDKIAAAKKRGKYCGGVPILGYDIDRDNKKLIVNADEAKQVQHIFKRFVQISSAKTLIQELNKQGYQTKSWTTKKGKVREGTEWKTGPLYRLLNNRIYIGEITHKTEYYPGEHEGIVDRKIWDKVQAILNDNKPVKHDIAKIKMVAALKGVIRCGHCNCAMGPTYSNKNGRKYTYYICSHDTKLGESRCPVKRVPAGDIEKVVFQQLSAVFKSPTLIAKTYRAACNIEAQECERLNKQQSDLESKLLNVRQQAIDLMSNQDDESNNALQNFNQQAIDLNGQLHEIKQQQQSYQNDAVTEQEITTAFENMEVMWGELFPVERNHLVRLIVEKVDVWESSIDLEIKSQGLTSLVNELTGLTEEVNERRIN